MTELPRRLWHIFAGLSLAIVGLLAPEKIFLPALISVTIAFVIFELVRLKVPWLNNRFLSCFRPLLRQREASTLTASAYFLIAAVIVFVLCYRFFASQAIAVIALAFVAVGDPIAGMVGERWSKPGIKGKSLKGSGACLLSCLIAGAILAAITHVALWVMAIGALIATLFEFLPLPVNDNLAIPLVSGGVMGLVKLFCG
jgi:glycerol-3-phosphate acyltransferase PlsY